MGKLFQLKEWLTVEDAARHLAIVFGEEVTEADVLRLGLDGRLRLSVNFVNHAMARRGIVVRYTENELIAAIEAGRLPEDLEWFTVSPEMVAGLPGIADEHKGKCITYLRSKRIDDTRLVNLEDDVKSIEGVWDLPMVGSEQIDIEHKYQFLTGGPRVTLESLDGAFVERLDGEICQIQESFDNNEFQSGSKARLEKLQRKVADKTFGAVEAAFELSKYKEHRKQFLAARGKRRASANYYPSSLPEDCVLVVRTAALQEFENAVNAAPTNNGKLMTTTERNTLLTIIAALCDCSAIKFQERGAAGQIAKLTEEIGAAVTDDTIRSVLAKIPLALDTRMK